LFVLPFGREAAMSSMRVLLWAGLAFAQANSFTENAPEPAPETNKKISWCAVNGCRPRLAEIWAEFKAERGIKSSPSLVLASPIAS
jgi:hypothetical protein